MSDEVHRDTLPGSQRGIERLEQANGMPLAWLDGLAGGTGPNILIDECSHPRPVERAGEALVCLISSEMAGCGAIMGFFEQVRPEGALRDVQPGRGWSLFLVEEVVPPVRADGRTACPFWLQI